MTALVRRRQALCLRAGLAHVTTVSRACPSGIPAPIGLLDAFLLEIGSERGPDERKFRPERLPALGLGRLPLRGSFGASSRCRLTTWAAAFGACSQQILLIGLAEVEVSISGETGALHRSTPPPSCRWNAQRGHGLSGSRWRAGLSLATCIQIPRCPWRGFGVRKSWTTASRVTICPSATGDRARLAADRNRSSLASCLSAAGDTAWELPTGIV